MVLEGGPGWAPDESSSADSPSSTRILEEGSLFDGATTTSLPGPASSASLPAYPLEPVEREPSTLAIQVAIVALASVAVGLLVFMGIRSTFGAGEDSAALDTDGDSGENLGLDQESESSDGSTGSNQRYGPAQVEDEALIGPDESAQRQAPQGPAVAEFAETAPTTAGVQLSVASSSTTTPVLLSPAVVPGNTVSSVTSLVTPSTEQSTTSTTWVLTTTSSVGPSTSWVVSTTQPPSSETTRTTRTTRPTTGSTTRPPSSVTSSTTAPTTTEPTTTTTVVSTTSTTSTTSSSTSTSTSTSTTTAPPIEVGVLNPTSGTLLPWSRSFTVRARPIDEASSYCWSFTVGSDSAQKQCGAETADRFTLQDLDLPPGRVTIRLDVLDDDGSSMGTDTIVARSQASEVILSPGSGDTFELTAGINIEGLTFDAATDYCWSLTQDGNEGESAELYCVPFTSRTIGASHELRRGIAVGPATMSLVIKSDSLIIGSDSVDLLFTPPTLTSIPEGKRAPLADGSQRSPVSPALPIGDGVERAAPGSDVGRAVPQGRG